MHWREVMTIMVWFHGIDYRTFKQFYQQEVNCRNCIPCFGHQHRSMRVASRSLQQAMKGCKHFW
jgi:hypothetical protein